MGNEIRGLITEEVMTERKSRSMHYRVGKGRPPLDTRWERGQSGNLKGRPKGRKNVSTIARQVLDQKIKVQKNGKLVSISVREAILNVYGNKALKGDLKAASSLFGFEQEISENLRSIPEQSSDQATHDPNAAFETYLRIVKGGRH
jgi:hypothetical protein